MSAEWTPQVGETVLWNANEVEVLAIHGGWAWLFGPESDSGCLWSVASLRPLPPKPVQYVVTCEDRPPRAGEASITWDGLVGVWGTDFEQPCHVITKVEPL